MGFVTNLSQELDAIEAGLTALHRASFQHRAWEDIRQAAGLSIDRASAALLKTVIVSGKPDCRLQDIARTLGVEAPSVSRTVRELEQAGMVKRRPDKSDRRASNLTVTAAGLAEIKKLQAVRRQLLAKAVRGWPAEDRAHLARLLQQLADEYTKMQTNQTAKEHRV